MNRRVLICGLASLVADLPTSGYAQSSPSRRCNVIPEIAVISTESDYRLPAIREAVHFWNAELSKLGSPFRLGSLAQVVVQAIPPGDLRDSADPLAATTRTCVAKILSQIAPTVDVIVLLSDDFSTCIRRSGNQNHSGGGLPIRPIRQAGNGDRSEDDCWVAG
jgi:hypothetical protein